MMFDNCNINEFWNLSFEFKEKEHFTCRFMISIYRLADMQYDSVLILMRRFGRADVSANQGDYNLESSVISIILN